jgi:RND family efflux transporter MFP subunit
MRKVVLIVLVVVAVGGAAAYFGVFSKEETAAAAGGPGGQAGQAGQGQRPGGGGFGGPGGFGGGGGPRPPMSVDLADVTKGKISAHLMVVGNLIGQQTVDVVPKTGGRLVSINVQLGDRVRRGQTIAKIEDSEIVEQVRQAEASGEVSKATIRQREADLKVAEVNFERSKNLFQRQLLAQQSLDDAESKYLAAQAQLDLAKAQSTQTGARLEELRIQLQNTTVVSPVDGFVGKRNADPGAWASQQAPVVSVVEINRLRLVANVVEKDLRMVTVGDPAVVEVDAYPGDKFNGRIARIAPVLDPATRTASMEVEVPNADYRLKPGMYARITLTIEDHDNAIIVPKPAVVDYDNKRGVWIATADGKSRFVPVELGIEDGDNIEIKSGLNAGEKIVVAGAASLRAGDTLQLAGQGGPGAPPGGRGMGGGRRGPGGPGGGQGGPGGAGQGGARGQRPQQQ